MKRGRSSPSRRRFRKRSRLPMLDYLDHRNRKPTPFVWKADADLILGKIQRLSKRISNS